ncbi:MAG: hypothetical protein IJY27_04515 [Clostridia bacterium]|nr:hypothetical protein [Clostridia bacterium]
MRFFKAAIALMLVMLMLTSCTLGLDKLEYDNDANTYTDTKTGISYTDAPTRYEAVSVGEKYAKWRNSATTVIFHSMEGADPAEWLTESGKVLFYADGVTLPEPDEMDINKILVCVDGEHIMTLASIENAEHIDSIIDTWQNAEAVEYPALTPTINYRIKMVSPTYPWMYYNLIYIEYSDGGCYLYSRDDGRCVEAGDLIRGYLDGTIEG